MNSRVKRPVETEHSIQTLLKNYLQAKGYFVLRLNSGRIPMTDYRGKRRMIWMGEKGTPDLMAYIKCPYSKFNDEEDLCPGSTHLLFIEVKRPGKKPTFNQEQMMKLLEEKGARCLIATSIEDLEREGI